MPSTIDDVVNGVTTSVAVKAPCVTGTTGPITLAGLQTIGGITVVEGDRVLVKDQADPKLNGIYLASTSNWSRAPDFDGARDATNGTLASVSTSGMVTFYRLTTANPVLFGTSNITFEAAGTTPSAFGTVLMAAANASAALTVLGVSDFIKTLLDDADADTARQTLGAMSNPMTTLGDLIAGGASGAPQRLGIGSTGNVLTVVGGAPAWAPSSGGSAELGDIGASVASNALTVSVNAGQIAFRNATLTNGTPNVRTLGSTSSVVVPSGATLGSVSGQSARLAILAIDNAGTVEAAVINTIAGLDISEQGVISTTAISGASNAAGVAYSTTARSNVAYRVRGYIDITETTAGTWATAPVLVQPAGGLGTVRSIPIKSTYAFNTANGFGSTNTAIRRFTNGVDSGGSDITYTDSATLGATFLIHRSGLYAISYTDGFTSGIGFGVTVNSAQLTTAFSGTTAASRLTGTDNGANLTANCSTVRYLNAGDIVRAHAAPGATSSGTALFSITRIGT